MVYGNILTKSEIKKIQERLEKLIEKAYLKYGSDVISNGTDYTYRNIKIFIKEDITTHYGDYYENGVHICSYKYNTDKGIYELKKHDIDKNKEVILS